MEGDEPDGEGLGDGEVEDQVGFVVGWFGKVSAELCRVSDREREKERSRDLTHPRC